MQWTNRWMFYTFITLTPAPTFQIEATPAQQDLRPYTSYTLIKLFAADIFQCKMKLCRRCVCFFTTHLNISISSKTSKGNTIEIRLIGNTFNSLFIIFGGHKSFLWGYCYPCSGLLVKSPLGFKASVGSLVHIWQKHTCYTFLEIRLWCDTFAHFPHTCFSAEVGCKTRTGDFPINSLQFLNPQPSDVKARGHGFNPH